MDSSSYIHTPQKRCQYFPNKTFWRIYDLKSDLLVSEEKIINDIKGKTIEEETFNIIKWFILNEIPDKPLNTPSRRSQQKKSKIDDERKIQQFQSSQHKKTKLKYQVLAAESEY